MEDRIAVATWLGQLHGSVAGQEAELAQPGFLLSYDAAYFRDTAERALHAVGSRFGPLQRRLEEALSGYEAMIEKFCSDEPTLVHGSYRHKNILVETSSTTQRICPADWEWAGIGPRLHDLAFIADGYDRYWLGKMCESYAGAATACGLAAIRTDEMLEQIEGLRLHKALRSLARSAEWAYRAHTVTRLVVKAEMFGHGMRSGAATGPPR
jgi:aminoglycoside phosphotransferase (APT) family kinase protein